MALFKKKKKNVTVCPTISDNDKLRYEVGNLQGIGARYNQEDSFTVINALDEQKYDDLGMMFAVCDGMGGMKDGKIASETAIKSLRESFNAMNRTGRIAFQLKESVFLASEEVEKVLDGDGGSTVVTGIIFHEQLYFASVGDSYLYLFRNNRLFRLNSEQNVCHDMYLENIRDRITEVDSCRNASDSAALAQFLGMPGMSNVDCSVRPLNLKKGDIILACSDGVGGVVTEEEVIEALQWPNVQDECRRLEDHIIEHANPNQDNFTAFIVKCV